MVYGTHEKYHLFLDAVRAALQYAEQQDSRFRAWGWAEQATRMAKRIGIELDPGSDSWPDVEAMKRQLEAGLPSPLIVTRHAGLVEWLARRGITGEVVEHATPDDVRGRVVYGNLPLHLAALATEVVAIDMPGLPREVRGRDLTPEEMDSFGARLTRYRVRKVEEE